jgi:hypothetical protein
MFESRRKHLQVDEPDAPPVYDGELALRLREEHDPDPIIETMVVRLREGLRSLDAVDEWGRPLAWRNVLRMALGPEIGRLRDALTSGAIASTLLAEDWLVEELPQEPEVLAEVVVASQMPEQPPIQPRIYQSMLSVSADQRPVAIGPFLTGQIARDGRADNPAAAEDDGFLAGEDSEGKQVGGDQDRGPADPGLGDDLQSGVHPERVHPVEGLVEQQQPRFVEDRQNNGEPPAHPV